MKSEQASRGSVGVLGGGMLGLTLALRLAEQGHEVTVLEAAEELGGLAGAWHVGDVEWDRYYHVISTSDAALCALIDELGLTANLVFKVTRTNFYDGRSIWPLNDAWDYLKLPALSLLDKLRVAYTIVSASWLRDGLALESMSAEKWLIRKGGKTAWNNLWRPLLRSKLGRNAEHASAAYIWSVIRRFYGARHGKRRVEQFGYLRGGYAQLLAALAERLRALGVTTVTGAAVHAVRRAAQVQQVSTAKGEFCFDQVVVTFAGPLAAGLCQDLNVAQRTALGAIRYQGIVCASVLLRRALGNAYMTYVTDASMPFTTIIEMSSLVDRAQFDGHHLAYLPQYVPADDPLLEEDDARLSDRFLGGLMRMFPDLEQDDVLAVRIARNRHVMAIPGLDYSAALPPLDTGIPGLWIATSAHIVNASLSVNESIALANDVAGSLSVNVC